MTNIETEKGNILKCQDKQSRYCTILIFLEIFARIRLWNTLAPIGKYKTILASSQVKYNISKLSPLQFWSGCMQLNFGDKDAMLSTEQSVLNTLQNEQGNMTLAH